ncbi:hypothetical protein [Lutibacter sp.]|uniref:hypothetical protein n=1 Tax=Lutibacter sp. TaxID=1925666 RepID=UPI0034A0209B
MKGIYKTKPIELEAVEWTGKNFNELIQFCGIENLGKHNIDSQEIQICTLEDGDKEVQHIASKGDFIIKGLIGEFYPCKPDVFKKKYELVRLL